MLKQSNEAIARQAAVELETVGEFSMGDIDFLSPTGSTAKAANDATTATTVATLPAIVAPAPARPGRIPAGYLRAFNEYRPSDLGNADRVFDLYGDEFRYAPHLGWLRYQNGLWAHTEGFGMEREAVKSTIRQMGDAIAVEATLVAAKAKALTVATHSKMPILTLELMEDELIEARQALGRMQKHYSDSCSEPKIGACLRTAASDPAFVVRPEQLDADDYKLNTKGSVLDLITGDETPHDPRLLMTRTSATSIGPVDAKCPEWLNFLYAVFDDGDHAETMEMIDYMQVVIAYMLSGSTRFEALFILGGIAGGNGKSTFLNVVNALTGSYGLQVDCKTFQFKDAEDSSIPNDLAKTAGTRVTTIDELPKGYRFNSPLVKKYVSGTTPLTARFLHKEFFEWLSKAKLMIATNFLPVIRDDEAMWRRMHLVKFNNSFKARPDETLGAKLTAELPAIMRWAQQGITKLATTGLVRPERVVRDTEAYKRSQDDFGGFLTEALTAGTGYTVKTSQAFSLYKTWAEDNNSFKMSKGNFRRTMIERGFSVKTKSGYEVFTGLQVAEHPDLQLV